jgi:hypothetical protein
MASVKLSLGGSYEQTQPDSPNIALRPIAEAQGGTFTQQVGSKAQACSRCVQPRCVTCAFCSGPGAASSMARLNLANAVLQICPAPIRALLL